MPYASPHCTATWLLPRQPFTQNEKTPAVKPAFSRLHKQTPRLIYN
jgi:hypothetical protein